MMADDKFQIPDSRSEISDCGIDEDDEDDEGDESDEGDVVESCAFGKNAWSEILTSFGKMV
jgi:hypothetical protein